MADKSWSVPLSDLVVSDDMRRAVDDAVGSGWWSMGPRVEEFEGAFSELLGSRHAFGVANGTAALHLALLAGGWGPGDEVIVPSLNFVAAANTIAHVGATPVFCDVKGNGDLNLDPDDVAAAITPATKAIVVLHYGGFACDMGAVLELAERHGLVVIEDAAHAPGSRYDGRMCGTLGAIGCFSFFSNKNLPVGEGGMVVTDDDDIADRVRLLRSHGMTTLTWDRHRGHASTYDVLLQGFNYRLDEVRATMGLVQLRRLEQENAARRKIARQYGDALDGVNGLSMPFRERLGEDDSAHHLAVALVSDRETRDSIRLELADRGVQTSLHYPPIHRFTAYRDTGGRRLPRTEDAASRLITLPLFAHMRPDQVTTVIDAVIAAM